MVGYIYKTTDTINNKIYIGQHRGVEFNEKYKGSGILIKEALSKYGRKNFKVELIEECNDYEQLNLRERFWISHYGRHPITYNLSLGGFAQVQSKETRALRSKSLVEYWANKIKDLDSKKKESESKRYLKKLERMWKIYLAEFVIPYIDIDLDDEDIKRLMLGKAQIFGECLKYNKPLPGKHSSKYDCFAFFEILWDKIKNPIRWEKEI